MRAIRRRTSRLSTRTRTQSLTPTRSTSPRGEHGDEYGADFPLGVLGYSQGGLVALRAAALAEPFDRLALWNLVMDPMATYRTIFGRKTILDGARRGTQHRSGEIVGGTRLRPGFFVEILESNPIEDAAHSAVPILVVTGRRDWLVADGAALAECMSAARAAETVVVDLDAGHDLGALGAPELLDGAIDCTAEFMLDDRWRTAGPILPSAEFLNAAPQPSELAIRRTFVE